MRRRLFLLGGEEYRASALDKNKAASSGANLVEERQDGVHNEIVASQFPARHARENQGNAERIGGEKEKKCAKITWQ